jgi:hypothetical protein
MVIAGLSFLFLTIAGSCWGIMDLLYFKYDKTIFSNPDKFKQVYWDPSKSWRNKWEWVMKDGRPVRKERFPGSSTIFVRFTDAWHNFKSFTLWSICLSIATPMLIRYGFEFNPHYQLVSVIGLWVGFWITYESKLLKI